MASQLLQVLLWHLPCRLPFGLADDLEAGKIKTAAAVAEAKRIITQATRQQPEVATLKAPWPETRQPSAVRLAVRLFYRK
jgi:hypothetical protein